MISAHIWDRKDRLGMASAPRTPTNTGARLGNRQLNLPTGNKNGEMTCEAIGKLVEPTVLERSLITQTHPQLVFVTFSVQAHSKLNGRA